MKAIKSSVPIHISEYENAKYWISHFLINSLGISEDQFRFIGSFGKKELSSDIDIAVDETILNLDSAYSKLTELGKEVRAFKGFNELSFGFEFGDAIIQVDLMFGKNLDWISFMRYSPDFIHGQSKYAGVYRNLLFSAILITESRIELENGDIQQMILRLDQGIFKVRKSMLDGQSRIVEEKFVTDDPMQFTKILGLSGDGLTLESTISQVLLKPKCEEILERFNKFCNWNNLELWDKQNA